MTSLARHEFIFKCDPSAESQGKTLSKGKCSIDDSPCVGTLINRQDPKDTKTYGGLTMCNGAGFGATFNVTCDETECVSKTTFDDKDVYAGAKDLMDDPTRGPTLMPKGCTYRADFSPSFDDDTNTTTLRCTLNSELVEKLVASIACPEAGSKFCSLYQPSAEQKAKAALDIKTNTKRVTEIVTKASDPDTKSEIKIKKTLKKEAQAAAAASTTAST